MNKEITMGDERGICKNCNHNHIVEVGDDDEKKPYIHLEILPMCCECNCEKFKEKVKNE